MPLDDQLLVTLSTGQCSRTHEEATPGNLEPREQASWRHGPEPQTGTEKEMSIATAPRPPTKSLAQCWAPHQHPLTESSKWEGQALMTPFDNGREG